MGKTIPIGPEHWHTLPDVPKKGVAFTGVFGDKINIPLDELIIGRKRKGMDAYWQREEFPRFFYDYIPGVTETDAEQTEYEGKYLKSLNKTDTDKLVYLYEREMYRREHGVWFNNNMEAEYLTGDHYFFLQWMKMFGLSAKMVPEWRQRNYEYAEYREFQRDIFYLIQKVNADPNILGLYVAKSKKTGVTQLFTGYKLNKATRIRMGMMGVMSKGEDAIKVNMKLFLFGLDGLPMIFQPNVKYRGDQEGNIEFGEPPVRNVKTLKGQQRRLDIQNATPLDTRVWAAKTKQAGFDSPTMTDIFFDELPKYDTENKQDVEMVFTRNRDTVKLQNFYNGRIWIYSYPPEYDTKGFMAARKIYFASKLSTIGSNPFGRTETGLICFYVSALNSYMECFDRFGKCDQKRAHALNQLERNSTKDKRQKQALTRLYSENERECWSSSGAGSTFDNARLGRLKYDLDLDMKAKRFFTEGRLDWAQTIWEIGAKDRRPSRTFADVKYVPLSEDDINGGEAGRLRIYEMPPRDMICASLRRQRDEYGNLMPPPYFFHYGAVDPTELAEGAEVNQGSKNGSYTMNFHNDVMNAQRGRIASNVIVSEYFDRPNNPEEFYQDTVKEILYFDKVVIVEANKKWVATRLIADGLGRFMLVRKKSTGLIVLWTPELQIQKDYTLISTTADDKTNIVRVISKWIVEPAEGETDYGKTIKAERLINQLMDFDPENSKIYDLVMAWGWCLICGELISAVSNNYEDPMYSASNVQAALHSIGL